MDMAIIHLEDPLILNEQIQPACLPPRDLTLQNKDSVYWKVYDSLCFITKKLFEFINLHLKILNTIQI